MDMFPQCLKSRMTCFFLSGRHGHENLSAILFSSVVRFKKSRYLLMVKEIC